MIKNKHKTPKMKKIPQKGSKTGVYFYSISYLIATSIDSFFVNSEASSNCTHQSKWEKKLNHHEELIKGMI